MTILALDLATQTGWAIIRDGRIHESGSQSFEKKRGESNGLLFLRARKWLNDFAPLGINLVAYEQAHHRGGAATEICIGLQTRAQEIAEQWGIPSLPVNTSQAKKFATGRGTAKKPAMIAWAAGQLGRQPLDDNEADAIAVGLFAAGQMETTPKTWDFA